MLRLFGVKTDPDSQILAVREEIAGAIALGHSEGAVEKEDRDRLLGALDLSDRTVEEIMRHRSQIEMIDADAAPDEILTQALASPHTRLPVFRGEPENIIGVLHAKDLLREVDRLVRGREGAAGSLSELDVMKVAMKPYFVPETTTLDDQMRQFLRRRTHFALVVDEYGALQGLITLEDILEEIVGEITDEFDIDAERAAETPEDRRLPRRRRDDDPRPQPRHRLEPARRGGQHHRRPRHPRGADDPGRGPGVQLPRLPLRGGGAQGEPAGQAQDPAALERKRFRLTQSEKRS